MKSRNRDGRARAGDPLGLAEYLQAVTRRGDPAYLAKPKKGQFAVLDVSGGTKFFYEIPRAGGPCLLHSLVEDGFGAPAERIEEFVWAV